MSRRGLTKYRGTQGNEWRGQVQKEKALNESTRSELNPRIVWVNCGGERCLGHCSIALEFEPQLTPLKLSSYLGSFFSLSLSRVLTSVSIQINRFFFLVYESIEKADDDDNYQRGKNKRILYSDKRFWFGICFCINLGPTRFTICVLRTE